MFHIGHVHKEGSYTVKNPDFQPCMNEQQEQRLLNCGMDSVGMCFYNRHMSMCFHNRHMPVFMNT